MTYSGEPIEYPTDMLVVEVMNAAGGATEMEVIKCLEFFYKERALRPGVRGGPRTFRWFVTVVQDYFTRKSEREEAANPCGHAAREERNSAMLEASFALF